jgi:hypothetical protein
MGGHSISSRLDTNEGKKIQGLASALAFWRNAKLGKSIKITLPLEKQTYEIVFLAETKERLEVSGRQYQTYRFDSDIKIIKSPKSDGAEGALRQMKVWVAEEGRFKDEILKVSLEYRFFKFIFPVVINADLVLHP